MLENDQTFLRGFCNRNCKKARMSALLRKVLLIYILGTIKAITVLHSLSKVTVLLLIIPEDLAF